MTYKGFISTLMAAAIAITSVSVAAQPAKADDTAKIIAGVAALAIIGAAIADNRNDRYRNGARYYNGHGKRHYRGHGNRYYDGHGNRVVIYQNGHRTHGYGYNHYHKHRNHRFRH